MSTNSATTRSSLIKQLSFEAMFRQGNMALFECDPEGLIVRANKAWSHFLGMPPEKCLGKNWFKGIHFNDYDHIVQLWSKLNADSVIESLNFSSLHTDGNIIDLQGHVIALNYEDQHLGFIGWFRDITNEKNNAVQLKGYQKELDTLIEAQISDVKRAKEEAEQANDTKTEFLANISHELRTPLHAITNFCKLAKEKIDANTLEKVPHYLDNMLKSSDRLLILINDLLDLSKLEAGKMSLAIDEHDIRTAIDQVIAETSSLLSKHNIDVFQDDPDFSTHLFFDWNRIVQVLINVVSNAIKFSRNDSMLEISYSQKSFYSPTTGQDIEGIVLSISDQGIGIPEEELDIIFDHFIQSSKTKTGAGGTGLGLSICRLIMYAHHGDISARNNPGGGACFNLYFPAKPYRIDQQNEDLSE